MQIYESDLTIIIHLYTVHTDWGSGYCLMLNPISLANVHKCVSYSHVHITMITCIADYYVHIILSIYITAGKFKCPKFGRGPANHLCPPSHITPSQLHPPQWTHTPSTTQSTGGKTACIIPATLVAMVQYQGVPNPPFPPFVSFCISIDVICGKYRFGKKNIFSQT